MNQSMKNNKMMSVMVKSAAKNIEEAQAMLARVLAKGAK